MGMQSEWRNFVDVDKLIDWSCSLKLVYFSTRKASKSRAAENMCRASTLVYDMPPNLVSDSSLKTDRRNTDYGIMIIEGNMWEAIKQHHTDTLNVFVIYKAGRKMCTTTYNNNIYPKNCGMVLKNIYFMKQISENVWNTLL